MAKGVSKEQAGNLKGKNVIAQKKDGSIVTGKLVTIRGNTLILEDKKGKSVKTKAFLPLALFDVAAIGAGTGFGFGPGFNGFGGFGPGFNGFGGFGPGFFF